MLPSLDFAAVLSTPVTTLEYRDLTKPAIDASTIHSTSDERNDEKGERKRADVELSQQEFDDAIRKERTDAAFQTEQRLMRDLQQKVQAEREAVAETIRAFETERSAYYSRVETEVVQLALAIAAKILHREVQMDPMLLSALVRVAIDQMREGSRVTVRVSSNRVKLWRDHLTSPSRHTIQIEGDSSLSDLDCVLETEVGTANFGLDTQLKEIERGFFDLLALRPVNG